MQTFTLILVLVIPIAAVSYVIWDYKRKTAQRNAESAERLAELFGTPVQGQAADTSEQQEPRPPLRMGAATIATPAVRRPRADPASVGPLYVCRERMLSSPQTLLYYLLKTGLPEHLVFARANLAAILESGAGLTDVARDEMTRQLAALTVDFVVVDKNMHPVATVDLTAGDQGSAAQQADRQSARTRLAAAGVRYIEVQSGALPRKEGVRSLVLGEDAAPEPDLAKPTPSA